MRDPDTFWKGQRVSLDRSWRSFRKGDREVAPDLCAAFERIAETALAAGDDRMARRAERMARRFSRLAALESYRRLLARVRRLNALSPEAAAALDARWEEQSRDRVERAIRKTKGRPIRRLRRALSRRRFLRRKDLERAIEKARRKNARRLDPPSADALDSDLRRFRAAIVRERDLAFAASEPGASRPAALRERENRVAHALDHWHELAGFRRLLVRERSDAEVRGAVTLALGLDRLIASVDASLPKARREALKAARSASNVVSFQRRSA